MLAVLPLLSSVLARWKMNKRELAQKAIARLKGLLIVLPIPIAVLLLFLQFSPDFGEWIFDAVPALPGFLFWFVTTYIVLLIAFGLLRNYLENLEHSELPELLRGARAEREDQLRKTIQDSAELLGSLDESSPLWPLLHEVIGTLATASSGEPTHNLEQAIEHFQLALEVYTRDASPEQWARTQFDLGLAYGRRVQGERVLNLEQAIEHFQLALEVYTRDASPEQWAGTQFALGLASTARIQGERALNLEQAIEHHRQALEVYTRDAFPEEWARTQNSLGTAYRLRIHGDREENLERAIEHHRLTLQHVYTRDAFPEEWVETHNNLGTAYAERIRGERPLNLERAIKHYSISLEVCRPDFFPESWASTQYNLGNAHIQRIQGDRALNLEQAIEHYQHALEVYTRDALPEDWARTQNSLGTVYAKRVRGERPLNLEEAIEHHRLALEVYTRDTHPESWAGTHAALGFAYRERIRGERALNLEQAIEHHRQALEVYTRDALPEDWARTQNSLGTVYAKRVRGERPLNLEEAIEHHRLALEVYTRDTHPESWAGTHAALGFAYRERIRGERALNLEQAIEHFQLALGVYTREAFPENWAGTHANLGTAYAERIQGERLLNFERSIKHHQFALEVQTAEAFPAEWATSHNNLGLIYAERIQGEHAQNLEEAIVHLNYALEVYTRDAFPHGHSQIQSNLGKLLFTQESWNEAIQAYRGALSAGQLLYGAAATQEARYSELVPLRHVPAHLSYSLLKACGDANASLEEAVLVVEQNRARWLSEALTLRTEQPAEVSSEVWQGFLESREQVEELQAEARLPDNTPSKRDYLTLSSRLAAAYKALDERVTEIRAMTPGFLPAPGFADIQDAARRGPLVYLCTTSAGSLALIVYEGGVVPVGSTGLEDFTDELLLELLKGPLDHPQRGGWLGRDLHRHEAFEVWLEIIDDVTRRLWDGLMGPVAVALHAVCQAGEEQKASPVVLAPFWLACALAPYFRPIPQSQTHHPASRKGHPAGSPRRTSAGRGRTLRVPRSQRLVRAARKRRPHGS